MLTRRLSAYWHILHPYTSMAVAGVTMLLAKMPGENLTDLRIVMIGLTMVLIQFSIGLSNDLLDQKYDRIAKPNKPLTSGLVKPLIAQAILALLVISGWILGYEFGIAAFGVLLFGHACGIAYNLGLKRTIYSWIPHALAAPTILVWVRLINGVGTVDLLWVYLLGLIIGPALNIANQLEGAEEAAASGEHSLVHRLGVRRSHRLAALLFVAAGVAMLGVIFRIGGDPEPARTAATVAILPLLTFIYLSERDRRELLWPLALLLGATFGLGFHLSLPM